MSGPAPVDTSGWTVGVRPARPADEDAGGRVRSEVTRVALDHRGGEALVAATAAGEPGREGGDAAVLRLVGTIGPVVVGALDAVVAPDGTGARVATITFIGVEPAARGVGVGRALLRGARDWAVTEGATELDAVALPGDRSTKNFFEAHGLVARLIVVRSPLR